MLVIVIYISWLGDIGLYLEDYLMYKAVTLAGGIREPLLSCSSLSIFFCLQGKFVSQFSEKLYKLPSSNMAFMWRMSDCIMELRRRLVALTLPFFSYIFSFPLLDINIENLCHSFLGNF